MRRLTAAIVLPTILLSTAALAKGFSPHRRALERSPPSSYVTNRLPPTPVDATPFAPASTALHLSGGGDDDETDATTPTTLRRELLAEFLGTYLLVQLGCGVVCSAVYTSSQIGLWQIAAVWSLAVTIAIGTTASVSGAHLNPAITISLALFRGFRWAKVIPFCIAQVCGAVSAAALNFVMYAEKISSFEGANGLIRGALDSVDSAKAFGEYFFVPWRTAFLAEAVGTAILAFVVFALTNPKNETTSKHGMLVPPLIGGTVGALISFIAPLTQAGFNPARDFGPRIVAMLAGWGRTVAMQGWWVYVLGPLVGAPIGAFVADKILYPQSDE